MKGRDLTPRKDGTGSRLLSIYVTPETWEFVDVKARRLGTSKSEVLRYLLNAGLKQLKAERRKQPNRTGA